ncbi:MAG: glycosyltransferase [Deferribacteraceae bacterium]|jgi:glycosyltransferase involved in cell wall biosynthesis|nr:glycosyltransferase [Deferribacteraceae bacterium]
MDKISVIMPAYNASSYINKSIESVIVQSYSNWELIIIDDGSTDSTLAIVQDFTKKDNRIIFRSQANAGQSVARNIALDLATGDYIMFLDADDIFVNDRVFENCVTSMRLGYGLTCFNATNGKDRFICGPNGPNISMEIFVPQNKYVASFSNVWLGCFRRDIIEQHKIRFAVGRIFEDWEFMINYTTFCSVINYINASWYFYTPNPTSTTAHLGLKVFDLFVIYKLLKDKLGDLWQFYEPITTLKMLHCMFDFYNNLKKDIKDKDILENYLLKTKEVINTTTPEVYITSLNIVYPNIKAFYDIIKNSQSLILEEFTKIDKQMNTCSRAANIITLLIPIRNFRKALRFKLKHGLFKLFFENKQR